MAEPPLPEGEDPDPFVIAAEFEDALQRKYPKAEHRPWLPDR